MSDLTDNVRYDQNKDQIRIEGPVTTSTAEFIRHLKDQGLRQEKIASVFGGSGQQGSERQQQDQGTRR